MEDSTPTKWKYLIVSVMDGCVFGTNDEDFAKGMIPCEDDFVLDVENQKWLVVDEEGDIGELAIPEYPNYKDSAGEQL